MIAANSRRSTIKSGDQFNAAAMEEERSRISNMLRNNGYYHFQPAYISYLADTINTPGKVKLRVQPVGNIPAESYNAYRIGNINLRVMDNSYSGGDISSLRADTVSRRNFSYIYYGNKMPVRAGSILRNIQMRKGELYSQESQMLSPSSTSRTTSPSSSMPPARATARLAPEAK